MGQSRSVGLLQGIIGRSGGLGYHLAALYYSKSIWAPFRKALSEELYRRTAGLDRSKHQLIIIGISGGYCLDPEWVSAFGAATAFDIDPIAVCLARRRFRADVIRQDFFRELQAAEWSLEKWLSPYQKPGLKPFFLFSNLLGQLQFIYQGEDFKRVSVGLARSFSSPSTPAWLSFHDRLTIPGQVTGKISDSASISTERLAQSFARSGNSGPLVVEEHEIGEWIGKARSEFSYLPWQMTSAEAQIIEICGRVQ